MDDIILNNIDEVIKHIKALDVYKKVQSLTQTINNDQTLQTKISNFNKAKTIYNDCAQYGKHHPDLKVARKNLQTTKIALFEDSIIIEFKTNEKALQEILNTLSEKLNRAINATPQGVKTCQIESV